MNHEVSNPNLRILIVDDNRAIHDDFRKILCVRRDEAELDAAGSMLFGEIPVAVPPARFELASAFQGAEALEMVKAAVLANRPFAVAFIDVRMPPGWDGIETTDRIWQVSPDLQVVISTAYSDYPWSDLNQKLGRTDRWLILKKPFDNVEVLQLAASLTSKWNTGQKLMGQMADLEMRVSDRTRDLHAAKMGAEASNHAKGRFLANMSHEIRTPMNGVLGMTQLLLETRLTAQQRQLADSIRFSADALLVVINDILDFSRNEAGKLVFASVDFDLREVIEQVLESLARQAYPKNIELTDRFPADLPTHYLGDPGRVRQVLLNLLGNAIKFTDSGEVGLSLSAEGEVGSPKCLRFEIRDTGIGISPEAQANLFQAFSLADGSTTRRFGGTGLGLAISRQLVERMGGQIGLRSEPGRGSTFWFTLCLESLPSPRPQDQPGLVHQRVLVVDDNANSREILCDQLAALGMQARGVASGKEAVATLNGAAQAGDPYALALLDRQMPEMDGMELARAIKASPDTAGTRLILLTSSVDEPDTTELAQAGIAIGLAKPIRLTRLVACLTAAMGVSGDEAGQVTAAVSIDLPETARTTRILLADDNRINRMVALGQLARLGYRADEVVNGLEAVKAHQEIAYDVILMDLRMPEMDGLKATQLIRNSEATGAIPSHRVHIIAMTASSMAGDREKCLAAGMDDYLSKPVKLSDLKSALQNRDETCPIGSGISSRSEFAQDAILDLEQLKDAVDGDPKRLKEMVGIYLEDARPALISLSHALDTHSADQVARFSHRLSGASSAFGLKPFAEILMKLEQLASKSDFAGMRAAFGIVTQQFREVEARLATV